MTTLFALLAILQADPAQDKSGLFEFVRPAGWTAQDTPDGGRALIAPDGSGSILRFLRPEPWAGTPEAYHEALHAVVRQGAPLRTGGKPAPFGGFLRSEAVVSAEGGPMLRMTMYTAQAGDRFQGLFFAAASDAAFEKFVGTADGLVKAIPLPGARERAPAFEFTMPRGWRRQDDPAQGTVALHPADLGPQACGVLAFKPGESAADGDAIHAQLWTALTASATSVGKVDVSEVGLFKSSRAAITTTQGKAWLVLYSTKRGGVVQSMIFAAAQEAHVAKHGAEADALVAGISFPAAAGPALDPMPAGGRRPRAIPAADRDVKLVGLWLNGESGFELGFDPGGGTSWRLRSNLNLLALWENGIAYRGIYNASIFTDNGSLGVPEGLAAVDAAALAAQSTFEDTRFSRWTEKGDVVDIPENWHGALKLKRDGRGFVAQDGGKWVRLAPVDGITLDGTYVGAATAAAPESRLLFRKDGSFEAVDLVHALGGPTNNPSFPARGKGTYEFRKWSLILRFDGGYSQAIQFHASGEGLADAKAFVLAGKEFVKR